MTECTHVGQAYPTNKSRSIGGSYSGFKGQMIHMLITCYSEDEKCLNDLVQPSDMNLEQMQGKNKYTVKMNAVLPTKSSNHLISFINDTFESHFKCARPLGKILRFYFSDKEALIEIGSVT